jgi:hypothetical protein
MRFELFFSRRGYQVLETVSTGEKAVQIAEKRSLM